MIAPSQNRTILLSLAVSLTFAAQVFAQLTTGSHAVTTQDTPLAVSGAPAVKITAGQTVSILGLRSATQEAVVSYQPPGGPRVIGTLPVATLIAVDSGAPAPSSQAVPPAPLPAATPLDITKILPAEDIAREFKADKSSATSLYENKRIKFHGLIEKLELESANSASGEVPILYLKTAKGLPRLKVKLSNSVSSSDGYFNRFRAYLPGWWWGYSNRALDCRIVNLNEIQGRAVYRSGGGTSISSNRYNTPWFTLFRVGEPVTIEAYCKGLSLDVTFDAGFLLAEN